MYLTNSYTERNVITKTEVELKACDKAQREYTERESLPMFAYGAVCFNCNRNVYQNYANPRGFWDYVGVTLESASTELITGCPHCNQSFCD